VNLGSLPALRPTTPGRLGPCVGPPVSCTEWQMPHMVSSVVLPLWISGLEAATQGWGHNGGGNCKAAAKLGQAAQCIVGMPLVPVVFPMRMPTAAPPPQKSSPTPAVRRWGHTIRQQLPGEQVALTRHGLA
jgi:hypothetical protein